MLDGERTNVARTGPKAAVLRGGRRLQAALQRFGTAPVPLAARPFLASPAAGCRVARPYLTTPGDGPRCLQLLASDSATAAEVVLLRLPPTQHPATGHELLQEEGR